MSELVFCTPFLVKFQALVVLLIIPLLVKSTYIR